MGAAPASTIWGGAQVELTTGDNSARIRFDCADAEIQGGLQPGADGRFSARGRYEAHSGGSQVVDEGPARTAANATLEGTVSGDRMTLEIQRDGIAAPLRYDLRRGMRPKLIRCY